MGYNRILLKLSGEALAGENRYGIDQSTMEFFADEIKGVIETGVEIGMVIGGGNFIRGATIESAGIDRVTGDYMGMMATLINALAIQDRLESKGIKTIVQSGLEIKGLAEPFSKKKAMEHLKKKGAVIFACGTGNPYFTTDTAAALRALEIEADILLKATRFRGVYDKDPEKHEGAVFFEKITYAEVIQRDLKVMDIAAISLCMENNLPVAVFNIKERGNLKRVISGEKEGTIIKGEP